MLRKVLVANRGEIARRVMRTCRRLGIQTVAVYSDADAGEPHVRDADEAVRLGPAPAGESYLDIDRLVAAAKRTGADAVHPGYGFLAENGDFAQACLDAGLVFIGPRPETIRLMGDKAAAKRHLAEAGVPVVPGTEAEDVDDATAAEEAEAVGYPILIKAVAGGGGKGMREVARPEDLDDALAAARREAAGAFGDERVIIEKLVPGPRHVEIQVFGDTQGNVIHLRERECSIQRRHQKVVEETPSPAVDDDLRARMGAAAVRAAEAVGYVGAGTVELLLSDVTGDFYFLEMNTRLQVEHPVTECITGLDLVEMQLRIADGEPLGLAQEDVTASGHALEVRLYAEDPANDYLPQTGTVHRFVVPQAPDVRVDAGVADGSTVTRFYDPMLAKLVVHTPDRATSVERMTWLLRHSTVLGVTTNLDFLADVVAHPAFAEGRLTTGFLDEYLPDWTPGPCPPELLLAATVVLQRNHERQPSGSGNRDPYSPWRALGPWRTGQVGGWRVRVRDGDREHVLDVTGRGGRYTLRRDDGNETDDEITARVRFAGADRDGDDADGDVVHLELADHEVPARVIVDGETLWAHVVGATRRLRAVAATRHADATLAAGVTAFTSPMPGSVIQVAVEEGDHVAAGTTLVVVEAMKMENPVTAPVAGTVTAVHVAEGDGVDAESPLLEFDPDPREEDA